MEYKLIALDIDGTLVNDQKIITPNTLNALIKAQQQGVKVVISSGRMPYGVKNYASQLQLAKFGGCLICFNGGLVIDAKGEIICKTYLNKKYLHLVYNELTDFNVTTVVHQQNCLVSDTKINEFTHIAPSTVNAPLKNVENFLTFVDWDIHKILLVGEKSELEQIQNIMIKKYATELDVYFSAPWFLEIMPKGVDKGTALENLCKSYNIKPDEVIACGDNFNDQSMIDFAGLSVIMQNGRGEMKQIADYVTLNDNNNDGIAEVVGKFIL